MIALALVMAANAQPLCSPYSSSWWVRAMDDADKALADGDLETARGMLSQAHHSLLCLDGVADPALMARFDRQLALTFFFEQDDDAVRRWALAARQADPKAPWPAQFGADHPFRAAVEGAEDPIIGGAEGKGLLVPKKGGAFMNGNFLPEPKAPAEVPLLVQVGDAKGSIVDAWWQDGAAFPDRVLGPPAVAEIPKWYVPGGPAEVATVAAVTPAEPPPPVVPPDAEIPTEIAAGAYIDPFIDARRRALTREVSSRESTDAHGTRMVVRTEVLTFASDGSQGRAVSVAHFADWLKDYPEWAPSGARTKMGADATYLSDWAGGQAPADTARPVFWISYGAAAAYCGSWGNQVADASLDVGDVWVWEWRLQAGKPVLKGKDGTIRPADPKTTGKDITFRCAP